MQPSVDPLPTTAGRLVDPLLRRECGRVHAEIAGDAGGGSSLCKVLVLGDLIVAHGLRTMVEIGVYRGRLLLPLARLLTGLGAGQAIGIDPYTADAAVQTDDHGRGVDLRAWPFSVNWDEMYAEVRSAAERWGVSDHLQLIRESSRAAAADFGPDQIDLLHVDGNHDAAAVSRDLEDYLPSVRSGGFVVLDDASWPSVRPHFERLACDHRLVFSMFDSEITLDGVGGNDFAVFQIVAAPGE